jgi:hypothetical protein
MRNKMDAKGQRNGRDPRDAKGAAKNLLLAEFDERERLRLQSKSE